MAKGYAFIYLVAPVFFVAVTHWRINKNLGTRWSGPLFFLLGFATSFTLAAFREFKFHREIGKLKRQQAAKDKEIAERDKTIAGLRREIAQANERIARQASYYMEELRRLGSGVGNLACGGGARRCRSAHGIGSPTRSSAAAPSSDSTRTQRSGTT